MAVYVFVWVFIDKGFCAFSVLIHVSPINENDLDVSFDRSLIPLILIVRLGRCASNEFV